MRQFVVLGHAATTDPDVPLDDLAGGAGRLDVLCRCVGAAFCLSHGLREDVRVHLVLRDRLTVRLEGRELRYLAPDERNVASLLRKAFEAAADAVGHREAESTPGIYVAKRGVEGAMAHIEGTVIELHEGGAPVTDLEPPADPVFVLSDHQDFTDDEAAFLDEIADERVRLGPERLHADHAITVAHNYLDTRGYERY